MGGGGYGMGGDMYNQQQYGNMGGNMGGGMGMGMGY